MFKTTRYNTTIIIPKRIGTLFFTLFNISSLAFSILYSYDSQPMKEDNFFPPTVNGNFLHHINSILQDKSLTRQFFPRIIKIAFGVTAHSVAGNFWACWCILYIRQLETEDKSEK